MHTVTQVPSIKDLCIVIVKREFQNCHRVGQICDDLVILTSLGHFSFTQRYSQNRKATMFTELSKKQNSKIFASDLQQAQKGSLIWKRELN